MPDLYRVDCYRPNDTATRSKDLPWAAAVDLYDSEAAKPWTRVVLVCVATGCAIFTRHGGAVPQRRKGA